MNKKEFFHQTIDLQTQRPPTLTQPPFILSFVPLLP